MKRYDRLRVTPPKKSSALEATWAELFIRAIY
jgi:hypothetical protein